MARRLTDKQKIRIAQQQQTRREQAAAPHLDDYLPNDTPQHSGRAICQHGAHIVVEDVAGQLVRCSVRQNLGAITCGDHVLWQSITKHTGVITACQPRHSLLTRLGFGGREKRVAANIDQIVVVIAAAPTPSPSLIDRYFVAVERLGLPGILLINKSDLIKAQDLASVLTAEFTAIGYPVLHCTTHDPHSLGLLKIQLADKTSILVGQSGVGKSSLINALLPERDLRVQAINQSTGLGNHTTSASTLYALPEGGYLIDSPGVRSFNLDALSRAHLDTGFKELKSYLGCCKFSDCRHLIDPGCALSIALSAGEVSERRVKSYLQLRASCE